MDKFLKRRRLDPVFNEQPRSFDDIARQRLGGGLVRVRDNAKMVRAPGYDGPDKCQDGYVANEAKRRGERGSCVKKGEKKKKKRKKRPSKTKKDAESSTDASSSEDEKKD